METKEDIRKVKSKNRTWLVFSLGLIIGFILSISIFLIDRYFFSSGFHFNKNIESVFQPVDTIVASKTNELKTQKSHTTEKPSTLPSDSIAIDTNFVFDAEEALSFEDAEFSIEEDEEEDVVVLDKILANKRVKVKFQQTGHESSSKKENPVQYFEIQQWSTPIRNRIYYQCNQNVLKIKGMNISEVEIYNVDGQYYLYNSNRLYPFKNNQFFVRLVDTNLTIQK